MTADRDIEKVLDRWLQPDADRIPGRVIERAVENTQHIPQRRPNGLSRRYDQMPRNLRLLGVAAVLAATGAATLIAVGGGRITDAWTATDILSINASAATWSAQRPAVFGRSAGTYELDTYDTLIARSIGVDDGSIFLGLVVSDGDTARIGSTLDCPTEGEYAYRVSEDHLRLDVEVVDDACADRRALLVGAWGRSRADQTLELGRTYRLDMGILVEITVPSLPGLEQAGPYVVTESRTPGSHPSILRVGTDVIGTHDKDYELRVVTDPRIARDVCDVAQMWLDAGWTLDDFTDRARAGTRATFSDPASITVGGYPAVVLDATSRPDCFNDQFSEAQCCADDLLWFGTGGRLWAVDLGTEKVLIMVVGEGDGVTRDQLTIGQALVDSLRITPPGD